MNVFCNRESCRFQLNQQCRTSAISVERGRCTTYAALDAGQAKDGNPVFWGHLEATPNEENQER